MTVTAQKTEKFLLICLILLALIGWGVFLNFGDIPFDFHDWAEVNAPRIAFLKDAIEKGELPLHMPDSSALRGVTDRYFALPDIIISPQVLLLRRLSVGQFILAHTWLMIVLGFFGMLRLRKRFSLSLLTFSWVWILFCFNGHILSHYSVGHVTWGGYFLLTWFVEFVFELLDGARGWDWIAKMAFWLSFVFLQGSFHQFVWCVIFLGFLALSNLRCFWTIVKSGIAAALVSLFRILPPAMQMGAFDDDFLGGYRTPIQMLNAFLKIIPPEDSLNQAKTGAVLGWWEFDHYIGFAAMLFLAAGAICWMILRKREFGFPQLIVPIAVLTLFSFRNFYALMRFFRIPLFSGERVSSRFLIIPFVFILILAFASLETFLREKKVLKWAGVIGLIPLCAELWSHLKQWKVAEAFKSFPNTPTDLTIKTVSNHADPPYTTALAVGLTLSLLSAVVLAILWRKSRTEKAD